MKKVLSLIFAFAFLFGMTACGKEEKYIMTIDEKEYPVEPFAFITQYRRDIYYQDYVKNKGSSNGWDDQLEEPISDNGTLYWEYILSESKEVYLEYIFIQEKFNEFHLSFTEAEQKEIDELYTAMIEDYTKNYGDDIIKNVCDKIGITEEDFKNFTTGYSYKASKISEYLFGEGGTYEITDEKMHAEYLENYRRFKYCIFLKTDSDGNSLKVAELYEKEKRATEALKKAEEGTDFNEVIKEYSEAYTPITETMTDSEKQTAEQQNETMLDIGIICNSNGIYDTDYYTMYGSVVDSEIVDAIFEMETGENKLIETSSTFLVIQTCDLEETEELFELKKNEIFSKISTPIFENLLSEWKNSITPVFNEKLYNSFDPRTLDAVFLDAEKLDEFMEESYNIDNTN